MEFVTAVARWRPISARRSAPHSQRALDPSPRPETASRSLPATATSRRCGGPPRTRGAPRGRRAMADAGAVRSVERPPRQGSRASREMASRLGRRSALAWPERLPAFYPPPGPYPRLGASPHPSILFRSIQKVPAGHAENTDVPQVAAILTGRPAGRCCSPPSTRVTPSSSFFLGKAPGGLDGRPRGAVGPPFPGADSDDGRT